MPWFDMNSLLEQRLLNDVTLFIKFVIWQLNSQTTLEMMSKTKGLDYYVSVAPPNLKQNNNLEAISIR